MFSLHYNKNNYVITIINEYRYVVSLCSLANNLFARNLMRNNLKRVINLIRLFVKLCDELKKTKKIKQKYNQKQNFKNLICNFDNLDVWRKKWVKLIKIYIQRAYQSDCLFQASTVKASKKNKKARLCFYRGLEIILSMKSDNLP